MNPKMINVKMTSVTWTLVRDTLVVRRETLNTELMVLPPNGPRADLTRAFLLEVQTAIEALDEADFLDRQSSS
jgi:hypothetical protein